MLTPHEYCTGWRQVRIFLPAPDPGAHHIFHYTVTKPLMQQGLLNTPFFVSHYICDDTDPHDTDIAALPPNMRFNNNSIHASIRFRFRATGNVEQDLHAAIQNANPGGLWKSGFLDYPIVDGLSGTRFSDYAAGQVAEHERRSQIVGEMLHWNTRLYLDSFRDDPDGFHFERNTDVNNSNLGGSPLQSVLHMILNPRFLRDEIVTRNRTL